MARIVLAILTAGLLSGCGFRDAPAGEGTSWPLLYATADQKQLTGVYPDGRNVTIPIERFLPMPIWSPDGRRLAYVTADENTRNWAVHVMSLGGAARAVLVADGGQIVASRMSWSRDGRWLAALVLGKGKPIVVAVIDVEKQEVRSRFSLPPELKPSGTVQIGADPKNFRWSADSRKVLLSNMDGGLVLDTETGSVERFTDKASLAEWAGTSDAVYYFEDYRTVGQSGHFYLKKLGSGGSIKVADRNSYGGAFGLTDGDDEVSVGTMSLSPGGSKLAVLAFSLSRKFSVIQIYDLQQGQAIDLSRPFKRFRVDSLAGQLQWAPDENSLAVAVGSTKEKDVMEIQLLELRGWTSKTLARATVRGEEMGWLYFLGKALSWTE